MRIVQPKFVERGNFEIVEKPGNLKLQTSGTYFIQICVNNIITSNFEIFCKFGHTHLSGLTLDTGECIPHIGKTALDTADDGGLTTDEKRLIIGPEVGGDIYYT